MITDPLLVSDMPTQEDCPATPSSLPPTAQLPAGGSPTRSKPKNSEPSTTPASYRHEHGTRGAAGIGSRAAAVALVCAQADEHYDAGEGVGEIATAALATALPRNPRSIGEALGGEHAADWQVAITKERDACFSTMSYKEIDFVPPRYINALMAFRVSRLASGELKFKARLVSNGSAQVKGVDYEDSYSPTVRKDTILMVLHVGAPKGWLMKHIDIGNAYKEVPLVNRKPVYMKLNKAMIAQGFAKSPHGASGMAGWGVC
jgi:hypothetical protein